MSDGNAILLTIASTAIGSAASWFISRRYYLRSSTDLDAALRHVADRRGVNTLARMLEQAGIGKPSYDAEGNLTGVAITVSAHVTMDEFLAKATCTVSPPPQYDRQHEQPRPDERDAADV